MTSDIPQSLGAWLRRCTATPVGRHPRPLQKVRWRSSQKVASSHKRRTARVGDCSKIWRYPEFCREILGFKFYPFWWDCLENDTDLLGQDMGQLAMTYKNVAMAQNKFVCERHARMFVGHLNRFSNLWAKEGPN